MEDKEYQNKIIKNCDDLENTLQKIIKENKLELHRLRNQSRFDLVKNGLMDIIQSIRKIFKRN